MRHRNEQAHRRALGGFAGNRHLAARLLREVTSHRQSQAGTLADLLRGEERFGRSRQDLGRHPGPGIGGIDPDILSPRTSIDSRDQLGRQGEGPTLAHGVAGIGAQIHQHGFQLRLVGPDPRQVGRDVDNDADPLRQRVTQDIGNTVQQQRHVRFRRLQSFLPAIRHQPLNDSHAALDLCLQHDRPTLDGPAVIEVLENQRATAVDHLQHVAEIMRHPAGERPQRLEPASVHRALPGEFEFGNRLLDPALQADIQQPKPLVRRSLGRFGGDQRRGGGVDLSHSRKSQPEHLAAADLSQQAKSCRKPPGRGHDEHDAGQTEQCRGEQHPRHVGTHRWTDGAIGRVHHHGESGDARVGECDAARHCGPLWQPKQPALGLAGFFHHECGDRLPDPVDQTLASRHDRAIAIADLDRKAHRKHPGEQFFYHAGRLHRVDDAIRAGGRRKRQRHRPNDRDPRDAGSRAAIEVRHPGDVGTQQVQQIPWWDNRRRLPRTLRHKCVEQHGTIGGRNGEEIPIREIDRPQRVANPV